MEMHPWIWLRAIRPTGIAWPIKPAAAATRTNFSNGPGRQYPGL